MPIVYEPPGYGGDASLDQLVGEVLAVLQGYSQLPDSQTHLTTALTRDATSVSVAEATAVSRGVIEVGYELMWVDTVDLSAVRLSPNGRGWMGSQVAEHLVGDPVTINPVVPRFRIRTALWETISALYPKLYAVREASFTFDGYMLPLPSDADVILDVRYLNNTGGVERVRQYEVERGLPIGFLPDTSDIGLRLVRVPLGSTVIISYGSRPVPPSSSTAPWSDTGLPVNARDVLFYGALVRLLPALDVARIPNSHIQAVDSVQGRPALAGLQMTREFRGEYDRALLKAQEALAGRYPLRPHFVR